MKKTGRYLWAALLIFFFHAAMAAEVHVAASVDRNQMGIGDSFTLNIAIQADEDFEVSEPQLPGVPGLELINAVPGGRQSSSSMSIINGKTQFIQRTSQDFNYVLSPQREGTFLIPVLDIQVNGQIYKTDPIKIEVGEQFRNSAAAAPRGRPRFPPGYGAPDEDPFGAAAQDAEDLFEQLLQQQQRMFGGSGGGGSGGRGQPGAGQIPSRQMDVNTNEAFFVYLDVDKTEVYEGEQVTANWYIYTRANIESLDRVKFPDLKGFWKEIIEEVPSLQFTEEIVNGVRYRRALLASHALFPIKAGVAVIDEFRVKAKVRMPTQFGWGQPHNFTKASRRAEIKVLPLPEEGRTPSFSGAVGSYRISLKTDGTSFPAHQPFSVRVRYEGLGNAKLIDLPAINWPPGLEVYDTKSEARFFREGNSYKEFEILVIPRREGEMRIPSLELTYFDPAQKKYVSESTQELILQITPGQPGAMAAGGGTAAAPSAPPLFKPQPILQLPQAGFMLTAPRPLIYLFALLAGLAGLLLNFGLQMRKLRGEPEFAVGVNHRLDLLEKHSSTNDYRKVGSEATNLIYLLVAHLAGQKKADQEFHLLIGEISSKDQQLYLARITELFDYFQLLGFSPEEIMRATLSGKPAEEQVSRLKILAKEIVAKMQKEDKYSS